MSDLDEFHGGSVFNRGLGIRYVLSFKPTFPQGDAKKPDIVICEPFYCHEQTYITILLDKAIARIQEKRKRPDNLDFKIVGGTLRRNFDVTWSIGDSEKGILDTPDKYTDMISQCTGEIAMYIEQHDIIEVEDDEETEETVNFTIKPKEDCHPSARCLVHTAGQQKPLQSGSWTGTMVAEEPPLDTLSHVRANQQGRHPYIVVNITGTSDQACAFATSIAPASEPSLCPKLSLSDFGDKYGLSFGILCKLKESDITGPHGLRFLSATELRNEVGLTIGEHCDVLDALERWTKGLE